MAAVQYCAVKQPAPVIPVLTMRRYIDQALCSSACCR